MRCELARESFSDLVEGIIEPGLRETIETHIHSCAACEGEYHGFQETWSLLEKLPEVEVPLYFHSKVMQSIGELQARQTRGLRGWWNRMFKPAPVVKGLGWSVAALFLVGFIIQAVPTDVVNLGVSSPFGIGEKRVIPVGLDAIDISPRLVTSGTNQDNWVLSVTSRTESARVRAFVVDPAKAWSSTNLSTTIPSTGMRLSYSDPLKDGSLQVPVTVDKRNSGRVYPVVIELTADGLSRYVGVFLPVKGGLVSMQAAGQKELAVALLDFTAQSEVPVVADLGVHNSVVLPDSGSSWAQFQQIGEQSDLKAYRQNGFYKLSKY